MSTEPMENRVSASQPPSEIPSLKERFLNYKTLLSFILAAIIIYYLLTRVDIGEVILKIKNVDILLYVAAFFLYYASFPLRGLRWQKLLDNIGVHCRMTDLTEIVFISWFANCIVPAKLGDVYRGYLGKKNFNLSMGKTLGTIFTERIFDMVILFSLIIVTGVLSLRTRLITEFSWLLVGGILVVGGLISIPIVMRLGGQRIKKIVPERVKDVYLRFEEGTLGSIGSIPSVSGYTLLIWLLEAARLFFVAKALGLNISPILAIFISQAAALLTTLPITPAGLGAVEFGIAALLIFFGVSKDTAITVSILDRLISYWSIVIIGFLAFVFSRKRKV